MDADDTSPFNVVIKTGGEAHTVAFKPSWQLNDFRNAVEVATGVPCSEQNLSVNKIDLRFFQGPLHRLLQASGAGDVNLCRSGDPFQTTGRSVLDYRPMRNSVSCGAMQTAMNASAESFASRASRKTNASSMASLKSGMEATSPMESSGPKNGLRAYHQMLEMKKQRAREKALARPVHLRPNPCNPINSGCPQNMKSEQARALELPVQMATNPKWSTDLRNMNNKIGMRMEWERKVAASLTGSFIPELKHMAPKTYVDNPSGPCFEPGKAGLARRG